MGKVILYKEEARKELKQGVKLLTDAVASTLGAAGKGVIIDNLISDPFVTADGITVAQNVETDAPFPQIGVSLVRNVAMNSNMIAGDGTTTSIVLANAMLENDQMVENIPPIFVNKGVDICVEDVKEYLDKTAKKVTSEDLINVATISARGDKETGRIVGS